MQMRELNAAIMVCDVEEWPGPRSRDCQGEDRERVEATAWESGGLKWVLLSATLVPC